MANLNSRNEKKIEKNFSPMAEGLMAYCFRHKLEKNLLSTKGEKVEIIDQGIYNRREGADFFNAKMYIDNILWVGNVLIIPRSSDWYVRGYQKLSNDLFKNIILALVAEVDTDITDLDGKNIRQCCYTIPENVRNNYNILISDEGCKACQNFRKDSVTRLTAHAWMAALETEWLENATQIFHKDAAKSSWHGVLSSAVASSTVITNLSEKFMNDIIRAESANEARQIIKDFLAMTHQPNSNNAVEYILVNVIIPWLFAYGHHARKETLCDKAFDLTENTKPYSTKADTFGWPYRQKLTGVQISTINYLKENYCSKKRCCSCRFGHEFMRHYKSSQKALQLSMLF